MFLILCCGLKLLAACVRLHSIRDSTCSMRISRDVTSIVAALHPVEVPSGVRTPLVKTESYSVILLFHIPRFIASDWTYCCFILILVHHRNKGEVEHLSSSYSLLTEL